MSVNLIILLPHYNNYPLRLINREILDNMPMYEQPNESEWNRPGDLVTHQAEYETLPTPPDS